MSNLCVSESGTVEPAFMPLQNLSVIRSATANDAAAIARIYNHYVFNTCVTFDEQPVSTTEMRARIVETLATHAWLVYEHSGVIEGYAYAHSWHARRSYRYSVETSIYLDPEKRRGGRGTRLYGELLKFLKSEGLHVAIGGIALPNEGSVALHERFGFQKVAHYREVGRKFDHWIDVGYWQVML